MKDKKDKLKGRLFCEKLKQFQKDEDYQLQLCIFCRQLFTFEQLECGTSFCPESKSDCDVHGRVIADHVPDRDWDYQKFLTYMNNYGLKWDEIYWKIWAKCIQFECNSCSNWFVGSDLEHCSYHPQKPYFTYNSNLGEYKCCMKEVKRFNMQMDKVEGCVAKEHQPNLN